MGTDGANELPPVRRPVSLTTGIRLRAAGRVVIYNADTAEFGEAFAKAFNSRYPDVKVEIISAGVGQLFTRVKAEAA